MLHGVNSLVIKHRGDESKEPLIFMPLSKVLVHNCPSKIQLFQCAAECIKHIIFLKELWAGCVLMNSSSSIILLYGSNNIKKSIFPSAAVCKIGLVSDYLVIHPVIYKLLAHSSVQREDGA